MDFAGRKVGGAIEREQVTAVEIDKRFQCLAPLQTAEDIPEGRPHTYGLNGIDDGSHLRVGRGVDDAVDGAEVIAGILTALIEGQQ